MGVEIERKFLVNSEQWKNGVERSVEIKQVYLSTTPERTVRVRIKGEKGFLTIKGKTQNLSRAEFEYEVPLEEALGLLKLCEGHPIEKVRHEVRVGGKLWEVDVFEGENAGLVLAEIELESEVESFEMPVWAGEEVSADLRYFNSYLSQHPFKGW